MNRPTLHAENAWKGRAHTIQFRGIRRVGTLHRDKGGPPADKGYSSKKNTEIIAATGATPFLAFQSHVTGQGGGMWSKMFGYFQYRREDFLAHYHKRSNVESTFSMIKRKFGDGLRSRTDAAMKNETMCKILCHNLVVLIHEMHELGIDPVFWNRNAA